MIQGLQIPWKRVILEKDIQKMVQNRIEDEDRTARHGTSLVGLTTAKKPLNESGKMDRLPSWMGYREPKSTPRGFSYATYVSIVWRIG
jgi:hypothetical protein